jgi:hypothetical protein
MSATASSTELVRTSWLCRYRNLLTGLSLMLAAWVLYLPSLNYGFVYYDDVRILKDHPELYGQTNLSSDLHSIFVSNYPREEPLLMRDTTWAVDSRLFGFGNPFGYHLDNVLLHGIVVALLFAFLLGTTRRYGFALATTATYLLLAVHVEPVVWIMGRKDILSALFMLLALCAQTRRLTAKNLAVQWGWYFATLVFLLDGLLSKISVLTFPTVLFLHAVFLPNLRGEQPPDSPFPWRRALREAVLFIPALAVSGVIYVWYQRILAQMGIFDRGYTAHGLAHLWNLLMVNPLGFWLYLRQIFLPSHLSVLYTWPRLQPAYPLWQIIVAVVTVAGIIGTGFWLFRRRKDLFFYFSAGLSLMIPYLNLVFIGIWTADRYVYFSSFCVLAIAVSLAGAAWHRSNRTLRLGVFVISAAFLANNFVQTILYEPKWRDAETLWQYHITLPYHDPKAYENLATYYYADFSNAAARQDVPRMAAAMEKMTVVVEAGLAEFWRDHRQSPPPQTYFLFFLRSLIEEVNGEPDIALASLLMADQLHAEFDATNLNLSRLYRKLAGTAQNPQQRQTYIQAARDRFVEYIKLDYRDRQPPPEVQKEMASIEAKCSGLTQRVAQDKNPAIPAQENPR